MPSCEMMGHDVSTIFADDVVIYRHGEHRFGVPYGLIRDAPNGDPVLIAAYERSMDEWLALVHKLDNCPTDVVEPWVAFADCSTLGR